MKPGLQAVLPRGATRAGRRKLSTATHPAAPSAGSPLYFDTGCPPPPTSNGPHGGPQPRLVKHSVHPGSPTTAITLTASPAPGTQSSNQLIPHPRYSTNSPHAYPGGGLPLVWLVPASGPGRNDIERRLPWEGSSEGKGKERHAYSLEMGAYGIPKRRSNGNGSSGTSASTSKEDPASFNLAVQVGEDAYFLRPDALGVADGVGGWKHKGESNSALFAKKLMHFCSWELARATAASSVPTPPPSGHTTPTTTTSSPPPTATAEPDPIAILQSSYERCVNEAREAGMLGSSTATLAILADSELRIAHVGDCVACVVRDGEIVFRSEEMQHSFNYPYQLGPKSTTTPIAHAQRINVPVKPGDIVILASDGMGDNLWDEDVLDEVGRFIKRSSLSTSSAGAPGPSSSSATSSSSSGPLSFAASSSSSAAGFSPSTSPSSSSPLAHPTAGPVTNTVLAQRLSEALASRAKRVSERRAMTADASGTMGVFAARNKTGSQAPETTTTSSKPTPPPEFNKPLQTPTPPPTPLFKPSTLPVIEGMELPIHTQQSITLSDGQLDEILGDGFGGDGEYGGSGYRVAASEEVEEEEEEWVRDEIPFGRRAREAGVRFVGGKGDDISVLVAIISGSSSAPAPRSYQPRSPPPPQNVDGALEKLRMNLYRQL